MGGTFSGGNNTFFRTQKGDFLSLKMGTNKNMSDKNLVSKLLFGSEPTGDSTFFGYQLGGDHFLTNSKGDNEKI